MWNVPTMTAKTVKKAKQQQMGRPRTPADIARRNRVVTLVTDSQFEQLKTVAADTERSVSAVVHQVISEFLQRRE
jgi:hypothetical protein